MRTITATLITIIISICCVAGSLAAERCGACGEAIEGAYFHTNGVYYHPDHFTCDFCSRPITGNYTTRGDRNFHPDCFRDNVALRCVICGETISGEYLHDHWGNAYHLHHRDEVATCDFCSRFATDDLLNGSVRFSDGRFLCRICHETAIKDLGDVKRLAADVARRLKRFGIVVDVASIRWHLVGRKKMQALAENHAHGLRGFTDYRQDRTIFGWVHSRDIDVYLLYGMPRVEMIGTIAHELMHVWQFLNGRLDQSPLLSEGSCNFASYLILKDIRDTESEFMIATMMADEDMVYGDGFRRVRRYVEENGLRSWRELLTQRNSTLPEVQD